MLHSAAKQNITVTYHWDHGIARIIFALYIFVVVFVVAVANVGHCLCEGTSMTVSHI